MQVPLKSEAVFERMVEIRRAIHQCPELAYEEEQTARTIMDELARLGIPYDYGGVGGGVVGRLELAPKLPTVALRAEMDALRGTETTGLPFASQNKNTMHACGHDGHIAMVLGAAALLKKKPPKGNVLFVFQPGEERSGGSRRILETGVLGSVSAIFAGHITLHYKVGEIMISSGPITAQSDGFSIRVKGKGGHGARPHESIDAVVVAGQLITTLQTLVSRETNPVNPSVITIGRVEAGSSGNVIAETANLRGTIRTTLPEVRKQLCDGIKRMARAMGDLHNASIKVEIREGYPSVVNTERETEIARRTAARVVGDRRVIPMEHPSMGSEDFAFYLQKMPGCYVRFGARAEGGEFIPLHSPSFTFDEEALKVGASYFDTVAREAIREFSKGST